MTGFFFISLPHPSLYHATRYPLFFIAVTYIRVKKGRHMKVTAFNVGH